MTLHMGEWLVFVFIVAMPMYSLWESDKSKRAVLEGRKTKLRMYYESILFLWAPTLLLLGLITVNIVPADKLGLLWYGNWPNLIGLGLVILVASYMLWHLYGLYQDPQKVEQLREPMQTHNWMMPSNAHELRWFTLGVSLSAGICEELLFRGFLLAILSQSLDLFSSLLVSSVMFGLCHVYQGWFNVLRTAIIGLILGCVYLLTESLFVVIALHALVDIYGGFIGYLVNKSPHPEKLKVAFNENAS